MTLTNTNLGSAVPGVRAPLLDCIQSNLAVLADHHHGAGTHLALGATLRFQCRPTDSGLPTVEPSFSDQLAEVKALGLHARSVHMGTSGADLARIAEEEGPLYIVADSYSMPWSPYYGRRHMEHSLIAVDQNGRAQVTDAYHNPTPWGLSEPGQWVYGWEEIPRASITVVFTPSAGGPPTCSPTISLGDADAYLAAYAAHPDRLAALEQLSTETWLLARSRKLHAAFRVSLGLPDQQEVNDHLRRWDRMAEQAYIALRRVQRGRAEPERLIPDLADTIAADTAVFGTSSLPVRRFAQRTTGESGSPQAASEVRAVVLGAVTSVFSTNEAAVLAGADLTDLIGYSSFRLIALVERIEHELGIEFDPEDLVPENLHRLDDLVHLATSTQNR
ncbi:hypothetical protein GCM10007079_25910 [Nocardiopsis terrae]|uniref:Acyl carrier protein n=1 Tax=Nocardiopsis terrae TaxID=372655 RepID=A0ABR9HFJ9_9ACTN|nr:acyl carrier protein [Nocardiopsis terrae]MBE1457805.1 acyl carrier protein [Nocardiopsis terrae]GHC84175.1 hypothetical protein GCM10007079_25910 [Nocardiopsis terrae]